MAVSSMPSAVTIVPLHPRQTKPFLTFPWRIYADNPLWVPPLLLERKEFLHPRKNPFFQHAEVQLFLAQRAGETVGRIAAIVNQAHDTYHNERAGFFGLFECLPHCDAAASALLEAATAWVRARGATFLRGPVSLSTNELDCGLLIAGFDRRPIFQSSYNPPYYADYIETNGFMPCKDLLSFYLDCTSQPSERLQRVLARRRQRKSITIRPVNLRHLTTDVLHITRVYNDAWSDNWGFVPITEAEAQHMAKGLKLAIIPDLALLAELQGEPVGCFVGLPDLNQALQHMNGRLFPFGLLRFLYYRRRIDTARAAIMGVKKQYRRLGIDLLLLTTAWSQGTKLGFTHAELGWILEDNVLMIKALAEIGAQPTKRYRLYQKAV
jgi:GNAT superfamily N-acetyltransferase